MFRSTTASVVWWLFRQQCQMRGLPAQGALQLAAKPGFDTPEIGPRLDGPAKDNHLEFGLDVWDISKGDPLPCRTCHISSWPPGYLSVVPTAQVPLVWAITPNLSELVQMAKDLQALLLLSPPKLPGWQQGTVTAPSQTTSLPGCQKDLCTPPHPQL